MASPCASRSCAACDFATPSRNSAASDSDTLPQSYPLITVPGRNAERYQSDTPPSAMTASSTSESAITSATSVFLFPRFFVAVFSMDAANPSEAFSSCKTAQRC